MSFQLFSAGENINFMLIKVLRKISLVNYMIFVFPIKITWPAAYQASFEKNSFPSLPEKLKPNWKK